MNAEQNLNLTELIDDFDRVLSSTSFNDPYTLPEFVEKIEFIITTAGENELMGLQDVCLLLQEYLSDIALGEGNLTVEQFKLICEWPQLALNYLKQPDDAVNAELLIAHLQDPDWPSPISQENGQVILEMLSISNIDSEVQEPQENHIHTAIKGLVSAVDAYSEDDLKTTLAKIIQSVDELASVVGENGLYGFQDLCLLLLENINDLFDEAIPLSDAQRTLLTSWSRLAEKYVCKFDSKEIAHALIKNARDHNWPSKLSDSDTKVLAGMMNIEWENELEQINPISIEESIDNEQTQIISNELSSEIAIDLKEGGMPAALKPVGEGLIKMLMNGVQKMESDAIHILEVVNADVTDKNAFNDAFSKYAMGIERFGNACQAAELDGLYQVSTIFNKDIKLLTANNVLITRTQLELLSDWTQAVSFYLTSLGNPDASLELVSFLQSNVWQEPLTEEGSSALIHLLNTPYVSEDKSKGTARLTHASPEDVSISLPEDINQELLDGLLQELPGQTERFTEVIQLLGNGSGDMQDLERAQRIAHTVKGAANTVGIRGIATLTHQLEDVIAILSENKVLPSRALAISLIEAADCLEEMSESLLTQAAAPVNALSVLQSLLDWANNLEKEGVSILEDDLQIKQGEVTAEVEDIEGRQEHNEEKSPAQMLQVPASRIDDLLRLIGELTIHNSHLVEKVKISKEQNNMLLDNNKILKGLLSDLERHVDMHGNTFTQKIDPNNGVFDTLELEKYNELHTVTNRLVEAAADSYELNWDTKKVLGELDGLLDDQSLLHREAHEMVMHTRMVPIKSIASRLQRSIRQVNRATGKQANLHLRGTDTLIDSDLLNHLADALMHILRNAVDHGIESKEERIRIGKPLEGRVDLEFFSDGSQIVVRCRDDGAGLDLESIRNKAKQCGILNVGEELSDSELSRLILQPGFSTKAETTQTSGRGIGMDVVYTRLLLMKGAIHIESNEGQGCLIGMQIPMTLITTHALLIKHRNQVLGISGRCIEQVLHPQDTELINTDSGLKCKVGDELFDTDTVENLLNLPTDRSAENQTEKQALLIQQEDIKKVIFIQELVDIRELFVKSIGKYLGNLKGILGATILGDGSVVPVFDVIELIRRPYDHSDRIASELINTPINEALPMALIVDDSLSARRALAQVIKDAGYDVRTAKDGLEALAIVETKRPDIILVDLEMPRMNGLELASYIRTTAETADLPIIMVTSRSTNKHKEMAAASGVNVYMTKPFSEDLMLDNVHSLLSQNHALTAILH